MRNNENYKMKKGSFVAYAKENGKDIAVEYPGFVIYDERNGMKFGAYRTGFAWIIYELNTGLAMNTEAQKLHKSDIPDYIDSIKDKLLDILTRPFYVDWISKFNALKEEAGLK